MNIVKRSISVICLMLAWSFAISVAAAESSARERLLMDFGWKFHLGNEWGVGHNLSKAGTGIGPASTVFSDASWRQVNLPHDWAIETPFSPAADASHGFRSVGVAFPQNSVSWYRRTFDLPKADVNKRIWLEFDGVFRDSNVFVNGWSVGRHESGYNGFRYDITDLVNCGGRNVVAVRVDATQPEGWFYEGAGIYRHVWLVKTAPVAIAPDGVFVSSRFVNNVPTGSANLSLQVEVLNSHSVAADAVVLCSVLSPEGKLLAEVRQPMRINGLTTSLVEQVVRVDTPQLWSPEAPRLYKLVTTVAVGAKNVDRLETTFGIRTVAFDAEKGFLLNGLPYLIKGTCNHQDHAGVGAALPDRLQDFRIARLKEMGSNGYRTSHNPPTPELLDACDRLGMIVMDENRLLGSDAANLDRLQRLIKRDRNHPSVVIWSIANEEFTTAGTPAGKRVAATMQDVIRKLDTTRPITYAAPVGNDFLGINEVIEVRGWNYHIGQSDDEYHAAHPKQPNVGTEQGSTVSTRGIYENDKVKGYVSAYDVNAPEWANTAQAWWKFYDARPWLSGGFAWTGFDYRGEPTPYDWPCINSHFGILDTCGFPKDNFWYYRSWWQENPVLHLLPHWNRAGREGQEIEVRALSNCDEVELFLNGQSVGRQTMPHDEQLSWKVKYVPGTLAAKGFKGGQLIAEEKIETTGAPAAVQLIPDRPVIDANGEDVSVITVAIADEQGRVVPTAGNSITFELDGPGRIIGVGNGDPSCHEADTFVPVATAHSVPINSWHYKKGIDPYAANIPESAEVFDDSAWTVTDVNVECGPLAARERAIFRGRFSVDETMLASPVIELWFGKIDGGGSVFVNGQKLGSTGDSRAPSTYDVKALLHVGENTVAVAIGNYGLAAGLNKGVWLHLQDKPAAVTWSRSVFNGFAQIIVQASKEAGALKLTASAEGLKPVTVTIQSNKAVARPALP